MLSYKTPEAVLAKPPCVNTPQHLSLFTCPADMPINTVEVPSSFSYFLAHILHRNCIILLRTTVFILFTPQAPFSHTFAEGKV